MIEKEACSFSVTKSIQSNVENINTIPPNKTLWVTEVNNNASRLGVFKDNHIQTELTPDEYFIKLFLEKFYQIDINPKNKIKFIGIECTLEIYQALTLFLRKEINAGLIRFSQSFSNVDSFKIDYTFYVKDCEAGMSIRQFVERL